METLEQRMLMSGYALSTLYSFTGGSDGANPTGTTVDSSGNLYGTAEEGPGTNSDGSLWELAKGSSTVTTLSSLAGGTGGVDPYGIVRDNSGNLYGVSYYGGPDFDGAVWELANGRSTVTRLYSFIDGADGSNPDAVTIDGNGNLFGTTATTGANYGTVWELAKGSSSVTTLYLSDGLFFGGITMDSSGNLYGITDYFGTDNDGTVWELAKGSSTLTTLYSFSGGTDGENPSDITIDSRGNLYGIAGGTACGNWPKVAVRLRPFIRSPAKPVDQSSPEELL